MPARSPEICPLPDGRRLAYDQHGDLTGKPVLWFHGTPSCRLEGELFAPWCEAHGVRLVAFDRPGVGGSDPKPGLALAEVHEDSRALLDHLGIERAWMMGGSGGGPYVITAAARLSDRLLGAVALAPGGVDAEGPRASGWVDRVSGLLAMRLPVALHAYFGFGRAQTVIPPTWVAALARLVPSTDAGPLRDPEFAGLFREVLLETFRQGTEGAVEDFRRLAGRPWGVRLADVSAHVVLIQGDADAFVPVRQAEWYDQHLPSSELHIRPGAGHLDAIADWDFVAEVCAW